MTNAPVIAPMLVPTPVTRKAIAGPRPPRTSAATVGREASVVMWTGTPKAARGRSRRPTGRLAGHPRNAIWFCHQHTGIARQHEHLDTSDGLAAIDAATGRTPRTKPVSTMTADQLPTVRAGCIARFPCPARRRHVQTGPPQRRNRCHRVPPCGQQMPDDGAHRDGRTTVKRSSTDPQGLRSWP